MDWLQRAYAQERPTAPHGPSVASGDVALDEFVREASFWLNLQAKTAAVSQLPLDTEYLRSQGKRGIVSAIARALGRGLARNKLFVTLVTTLGIASGVALSLFNEALEQRGEKPVTIEQLQSDPNEFQQHERLPLERYPIQTPPVRRTQPAPESHREGLPPEKSAPLPDASEVASYITGHEGIRTKVYDDGKGNKTIGIGHRITSEDRKTFKKLFGDIDFDAIVSGRQTLTREQIDTLFAFDSVRYTARARRLFRDFDSWPASVQAAIVDGIYRGDLSGSPKTIGLINEGQWAAAADEYLNNREYRAAKLPGVVKRMLENSKRFRSMAGRQLAPAALA